MRVFKWEKTKHVVLKQGGVVLEATFSTDGVLSAKLKADVAAKHGADELQVYVYGHSNHRFGGSFSALVRIKRYVLTGGRFALVEETTRKTNH